MRYDELTEDQRRKLLRSIERRLLRVNGDILAAGLGVYLANDTCHIMRGPTHDDNLRKQHQNSVHEFRLRGWGGGDW